MVGKKGETTDGTPAVNLPQAVFLYSNDLPTLELQKRPRIDFYFASRTT